MEIFLHLLVLVSVDIVLGISEIIAVFVVFVISFIQRICS